MSRPDRFLFAGLVLLAFLQLAWVAPVEAQGNDDRARADEGALFLLLPVGAQGVGLGRAMTAVSSSEAVFWNPAGLAEVEERQILLHRGDHVVGDGTSFSVLLARPGVGTLGVSYQLFDVGSQDLTDGMGNVLGSLSIRNHQALLSGAARLGPRIAGGMNVKHVRFEVACRGQCPEGRVTGSSYAVDLGIQSQPLTRLPLRLGAMVAHLGPRFQVENAEQADPLPARIRLAAAMEVFARTIEEERLALTTLVEVEDRLRDPGNPAFLLGAELSAGTTDRIVARGGYILTGSDQADHMEAAAVGLGIRFDRLELDIARSLARRGLASQQEPIHFTVGVRF
jgi:hypothetical protein